MNTQTQVRARTQRAVDERRQQWDLPAPGERRHLRKQAGLTLRDFGKVLGVSGATVHHWESGKRQPSLEHAKKYRTALDELRKQEGR